MNGHLRIAMCEDRAEDRERLARAVEDSLAAERRGFQISEFASGEALLTEYSPGQYGVILLDMHMGGMTGIETARAIRERDGAVPIVFVTVNGEFALESYQVRAAHYLVKPVSAADLKEVWARLRRQREPDQYVTLMADRKPMDIRLSDVLYAEADNKRCRVHTAGGLIITRLSIDQLQQLLPGPAFCRCHRGYIVNFAHVRSVGDDFVMKNGDVVYIRKTERGRIRELYFQSLISRAKEGETDVL